jgi:hypothetical protein
MKPNQNQLRLMFQNNFEFQARTKKGVLKDTLYMGIFKDTLEHEGLSSGYLHKAVKKNILEKCYIRPGRDMRVGYIFIGDQIGRNKVQTFFKKLWLKAKNLI